MFEVELERRLARALRAPVPVSAHAKQSIMAAVRRAARDGAPRRMLPIPGGRSVRHSLLGVALAASIGSITTMSVLRPTPNGGPGTVHSSVIGDSVVDRVRDTLRLVRLIFDDSLARQVAVVGDFNAWQPGATRMQRDPGTQRWSVTLALRDGEHRYAIVVDETRWVTDGASKPSRDDGGRVFSLLHVARASN